MDEIPFRFIILVLVIAGALLKPWFERRKKRLEEEQARQQGRPAPVVRQEEAPDDDGPKLPYEDLVEEVFGPYIQRRREAAQPKPPPVPEPAPAPVLAVAEPGPAPEAPAVLPSHEVRGETLARLRPGQAERAVEVRPIDQRIFGNRSLSPIAKLVLAAEILQPPRMLRGRSGGRR